MTEGRPWSLRHCPGMSRLLSAVLSCASCSVFRGAWCCFLHTSPMSTVGHLHLVSVSVFFHRTVVRTASRAPVHRLFPTASLPPTRVASD